MPRRMNLTAQIQKLDSAYNERKAMPLLKEKEDAAKPQVIPESPNLEEALSIADSVQNEQCSNQTLSKPDTVQPAHCSKQTVSKMDSVEKSQQATGLRLQGNYTQVPNSLLRSAGLFDDPFDFMIYLHLYSYSYGFGRQTVDMSQAQLEAFAGVSKNRVKRALDRLVKQKWIKIVGQYEHGRISRKWKVTAPEDRAPKGTPTVSKSDTVQNELCPKQTPTVSTVVPPTVSKMNTYKERVQKQFQINSLSSLSEKARAYFSNLKPAGRREGELQAFRELLGDYSEEEIWVGVEWLGKHGALDGRSCFAPCAYLRRAMGEVLKCIEAEVQRLEHRTQLNAAVLATRRLLEAEAEERGAKWVSG